MDRDKKEYLYWAVKIFHLWKNTGFEIKHAQMIKT